MIASVHFFSLPRPGATKKWIDDAARGVFGRQIPPADPDTPQCPADFTGAPASGAPAWRAGRLWDRAARCRRGPNGSVGDNRPIRHPCFVQMQFGLAFPAVFGRGGGRRHFGRGRMRSSTPQPGPPRREQQEPAHPRTKDLKTLTEKECL